MEPGARWEPEALGCVAPRVRHPLASHGSAVAHGEDQAEIPNRDLAKVLG